MYQKNYLAASSWHFTLFHEEDARSNNPQDTELQSTTKRASVDIIQRPDFGH
jgi:hypothetical protein